MAMCTAKVRKRLCENKVGKQNEVLRLYTQKSVSCFFL